MISVKKYIQISEFLIVKILFKLLEILPESFSVFIISSILRFFLFFLPKKKNVIFKNFSVVFPNKDATFYHSLYIRSLKSFSRYFIDFTKVDKIDQNWIEKNVIYENPDIYKEVVQDNKGKGTIVLAAHLGSFEILANILSNLGFEIYSVARQLKNPYLDNWLKKIRESQNNHVIGRKGSFIRSIKLLKQGKFVGILFDQNVKKNDAIFIPWFNKTASTTIALGYAAVSTKCNIIFVCLIRKENKFHSILRKIETEDIYNNITLSKEAKIRLISERSIKVFEDILFLYPEGWFWLHKRWKTTEEGIPENFYD